MKIASLQFSNLGPFDKIAFEFDPQINVFVGPNNCGKSTVLLALADLAVVPFHVPFKLLRAEACHFHAGLKRERGRALSFDGEFPILNRTKFWPEEKFARWEEMRAEFRYTLFVPALRQNTNFRSHGPTKGAHPKRRLRSGVLAEALRPGLEVRSLKEEDAETEYASLVPDAEIIQEIIELDYRAYRQDKPAMRGIIGKIASLASEITEGFPLEFSAIAEDERGLYPAFQTPDGVVPLNVLSQGTQSLIQWLARLIIGYAKYYEYPPNFDDKPGILIIDEIDAHLHPSWQRRIIPTISRAFPSLQIFCSTHSPLMLAGLNAGQVHLLRRDKKGKVAVSRNETDIVGWTADEIVATFLGVETATDLQTEENLQRLQELRSKKRLSAKERKELESLRDVVNQALLRGPGAEEVDRLADQLQRTIAKPSSRRKTQDAGTVKKSPTRAPKRKASLSKRVKK